MTTRQELVRATELLRIETRERQRAEEARLQLLDRLVFAEEEERRRIAREMHDHLRPGPDRPQAADRASQGRVCRACGAARQVDALEAIATQLEEDIDFLVWELRPTTGDGVGLRVALARYIENWSRHSASTPS